MTIKKGVYKYNTGEKDPKGNEIFNDIYFKTYASLVEDDENHRFTTDKEKGIWNDKASTDIVTQTSNGLMSAVDKKKLDGVQAGANAYVHPDNHKATMILLDDTHQFVTTTEKGTWNLKASTAPVTQTANGLMSAVDKKKLDGVEVGANAYVHPTSHKATMIEEDTNHKFVSESEKTAWNQKASTDVSTQAANGLMSIADKKKLDGIQAGANAYVHPDNHLPSMISVDDTHQFVTTAEKKTWTDKVDKKGLLDLVYPIGSIYMSVKNVSPSTFLGGTWVAWGAGRVPIGVDSTQTEFNTVEKTGGEKAHTLTINEIPMHNHDQNITADNGNITAGVCRVDWNKDARGVSLPQGNTTGNTGGGAAHNNIQPYITCYMWKRTA